MLTLQDRTEQFWIAAVTLRAHKREDVETFAKLYPTIGPSLAVKIARQTLVELAQSADATPALADRSCAAIMQANGFGAVIPLGRRPTGDDCA